MRKLFNRLFGVVALAGVTLALPTAAEAKTHHRHHHHRHAAVAAPHVTSSRDAEGYFQWRVVGVRNMRIYQNGQYLRHNQVLAMRVMGATEQEITDVVQALSVDAGEKGLMTTGMKFSHMSFSTQKGVKDVGKVEYVGEKSYSIRRIRASSGRVFTIVEGPEGCDNVGMEETPSPPPSPPAPLPPPPPPPVVEIPLPPPPATPEEARRLCDNLRVNAVVGFEVEPTINGSNSVSGYGAGGVYCMHRVKNGQIGFGVGGQLAIYGGDVQGKGHFNGHLYGVGPAMMRVWNSGHDLEVKAMVMSYGSSYREGGYKFHENRTVLGLSFAYNDYHGRLDGSGRPETQIFGLCGLPIGGRSSETWEGKSIGDGTHLNLICNAGIRQYLTEGKKWNPYIQAGILGESRSGPDFLSGSLRLGVSNRHRTIGCGAGVNVNLLHGGVHPGLGCWMDVAGMVRHKRTKSRAAAIAADPLPTTKE